MFNPKEGSGIAITVLSEGCTGKGELKEKGDVRIDGVWEGTINVEGTLTIGKSGKVNAEVIANNMEIGGTIEGNVQVINVLKVNSTANIFGDIAVPKGKLNMDEGAQFNGKIQMKDE
ncbi:MAG: polymer-forming cytoskeletal protein [Gemmatimonadetes bacterium]|nr:MAG: polymer-forming cytoskeletal protein [Gemmatimonadota bacterium]